MLRLWALSIAALVLITVIWRPLLAATVHEDLARVEGGAGRAGAPDLCDVVGVDDRDGDEDRRGVIDCLAAADSGGGCQTRGADPGADGGVGGWPELCRGAAGAWRCAALGPAGGPCGGGGRGDVICAAVRANQPYNECE